MDYIGFLVVYWGYLGLYMDFIGFISGLCRV